MTRAECIARVEAEFAQRRADNERDREAREAAVCARDPRIAQLIADNRALLQEGARALVHQPKEAAALAARLRESAAANQRALIARLERLGLPPDELSLRPRCPRCDDSGYAGIEKRRFCGCFETQVNLLLFEGANLPPEHSFEAFDPVIYPGESQRADALAAKALCEAYADEYPRGEKLNLILMGESGLGKTFLLDAIARRVTERGKTALRVTAFRMLESMRAYHLGQAGETGELQRLVDCPLLLIDDLGTEPMLRNISVEYLFMLLNERSIGRRHTVVATNMTVPALAERYGERVQSRLFDRSIGCFIRLSGDDLRIRRSTWTPKTKSTDG